MENLIVASTNCLAYFPIITSFNQEDYLTCFLLVFVATASFISHLVQNHKHDMPGMFDFSHNISIWTNYLDILGCILVVNRLLHLFYERWKWNKELILIIYHFVLAYALNLVSENTISKNTFIICHSLWHLLIFTTIDELLEYLYK